MPDKEDPVTVVRFTVHDLSRVRALVERAARAVGMAAKRVQDLIFAVNEVAVNAVMHGGGSGRLTVAQAPDGIAVEIADSGHGMPDRVDLRQPDVTATHGRGLWMAQHMCEKLSIASTPGGVTVRLFMPAH